MIRQHVHIPSCDWHVDIFYDVRPSNTDSIIEALWDNGCPNVHMAKAKRLLKSGVPNEGLAYSNHRDRCTTMVIGHTTDPFEFFNSCSHEKQHLEQAICKADGLGPYGEEIAYISGSISEAIARNAWRTMRKLFLCLI